MNTVFAFLIISLQWTSGFAGVNDITQSPTIMLPLQENATLTCNHTKGATYNRMYWFRQHHGETMELIVYTTSFGTEEFGKVGGTKYAVYYKSPETGSLTVKNLESNDDALYLCAVSDPGQNNYNPAYFGSGTKLTVLDETIKSTKPVVKIIKPSKKELCKKAVTLVCVAEDFYPDHVKIKWQIGTGEVTKGVSTDHYATENKRGKFDMSSRLKVNKKVWNNAKTNITCIVTYHNQTAAMNETVTVSGVEGSGFDSDTYMKTAQTIKLAYGVFIAKSGLYGLFILLFVRRQGSAAK